MIGRGFVLALLFVSTTSGCEPLLVGVTEGGVLGGTFAVDKMGFHAVVE